MIIIIIIMNMLNIVYDFAERKMSDIIITFRVLDGTYYKSFFTVESLYIQKWVNQGFLQGKLS